MKSTVKPENIELAKDEAFQKFIDDLSRSILYIDPDAPRHLDYIFVHRARYELDTFVQSYRFPNDRKGYLMADLIAQLPTKDVIKARWPGAHSIDYVSNGIYRRYVAVDGVLMLVVVMGRTNNECTMISVGDEHFVNSIKANFEETFKVPRSLKVQQLLGFGADGTPMVNETLMAEDAEDIYLANDSFYPFILDEHGQPMSIADLVKEYKEARDSLIVFVGPPGTGKTTLIRTMMFMMERADVVSAHGEAVASHPGLIPYLYSCGNNAFIYIEDADKLCASRKNGDGNPQMDALLGFTDGVVDNGCKLVIGTNIESLNKIDEALYRAGRCFRLIQFKALTADQANAARLSLGLKPTDFGGKTEIALAEALKYKGPGLIAKATGIGFGAKPVTLHDDK